MRNFFMKNIAKSTSKVDCKDRLSVIKIHQLPVMLQMRQLLKSFI